MLFAAGRGERLQPLTATTPKPALPLGGVPLGAFSLAALIAARPPVAVNVSHLATEVRRALAPFCPEGAVEFFVERPAPLGTAGTLRALGHRLETPLLTCNADLLTDLDPKALLDAHRDSGASATLAVRAVSTGADLALAGHRAVRLLDRRQGRAGAGALFLGMAVWATPALPLLDASKSTGLTEALLAPLVERGGADLFFHDGYALDVGTPERYEQARRDLREGRGPRPPATLRS